MGLRFRILAPVTIDFLAWLAAEPRDYIDVMEAWRTSCPRLTIWEDAIDTGLVTRVHISGRPIRIELPSGERPSWPLIQGKHRMSTSTAGDVAQAHGQRRLTRRSAKASPRSGRVQRMLQRLPLGRDVLCEFGEHLGAQLHRVLFVEGDARHPGDGIAAQRRESSNHVEGPLVGRAPLSSASTLSRLRTPAIMSAPILRYFCDPIPSGAAERAHLIGAFPLPSACRF